MKKLTRKTLCSLLVVLMCFASVAIGGFSTSAKVHNGTTYITKSDIESGYIELGSYPQTQVTDENLIATLNKMGGSTSSWTSYGYYRGTGDCGTMQQSNYMCYLDMTYNNVKYRGVYFSAFRPSETIGYSEQYQSANGYPLGRVCWFKYEPLKWCVLDKDTGLIMCESIIDSQAFNNTVYRKKGSIYDYTEPSGYPLYRYLYYIDEAYTNKANNFSKSSLRAWLNNDFYSTAFSASDKTAIANTEYSLDKEKFNDKVTLLGKDANYGFIKDDPMKVKAQGTDYAKCQGLEVIENYSYWHLFDALEDTYYDGRYSYTVYTSDKARTRDTYNTSIGVRPVMTIDMNSLHTHDYTYKEVITRPPTHLDYGAKSVYCVCGASGPRRVDKTTEHTFDTVVGAVAASCAQEGSITYSCACGATNTEKVPTLPHTFSGSVCTSCGYDRANDCSCNCHKSGIAHFFFVIVNFFQKLFGNNKICACGVAH